MKTILGLALLATTLGGCAVYADPFFGAVVAPAPVVVAPRPPVVIAPVPVYGYRGGHRGWHGPRGGHWHR